MTDITPVEAPTEIATGNPKSSSMEMKVETNYAPVEQKSPETVAPETLTNPDAVIPTDKPEIEPAAEVVTSAPQDNDSAKRLLESQIRNDNLERQLKELQPKAEVPEQEPNIEDQASWGKKYKDSPNDLETFLKAHADWAREEGKREERNNLSQLQEQRRNEETRIAVATKEAASRAKHMDFDNVVTPIAPIIGKTPILKDFLAKNPMGTEVMYELGKNPAVLAQIIKQDIWEAGETLINMANRLKKPVTVQQTNAPEPITPVGSREAVKVDFATLASKDTAAYIAARNKQELARKRAN